MRAVVQRTEKASVTVGSKVIASIGQGLTVFLGVGREDAEQDALYLLEKITNLRIFSDQAGKMNLSLLDIKGELLVVSQFTLYGDCRKGRRPGFDAAKPPEEARALYEYFLDECKKTGLTVSCGQFQADMKVSLINMGPVTMLLDSQRVF